MKLFSVILIHDYIIVVVVVVVVVVAATWYNVLRFDGFTNFANVVL